MARRRIKQKAMPVVRVDIISMEEMSLIFGLLAAGDEEDTQEQEPLKFSSRQC